LEPYFGVDGARALALEGVEYIIYVEKPGPIEVTLEHHGYDVAWINPANGERTKIKQKEYRGERFIGEPPDRSHDWILHISREGEKSGMLKSVKFQSRDVPVQEITLAGEKSAFDIPEPEENEVSLSHPPEFALKIRKDSRATRSLLVEWTAEVSADGEGYRVIGTGMKGTLKVPASIVKNFPAVLSLHANIVNANGKAYLVDRIFKLVQ
jgi:Putative collagen-binding domain of a collagenase